MTTKKTVQAPVSSDGVPTFVEPQALDKTRELSAGRADKPLGGEADGAAAPHEVVADEVTVPVQSSIESSLTFEMLRRQSTEEDEE